jgi:hypothetical protein
MRPGLTFFMREKRNNMAPHPPTHDKNSRLRSISDGTASETGLFSIYIVSSTVGPHLDLQLTSRTK